MHNLPAGWRLTTLGEISKSPGQYGSGAAAIKHDPNLPRYVRITDIGSNGELNSNTLASIDLGDAKPYMLAEGDLLFARSGATVGKTYLYNKADGPCAYAGYVIKFAIDSSAALPAYARYWTQSEKYWSWVNSTLRGGAQPNINAVDYSRHLLPIPPLTKQRRIIEILHAVDRQLSDSTKELAKLTLLRGGLVEDSIAAAIASSDRYRRLGELAQIASGVTLGSEPTGGSSIELPYLRVANVQNDYFDTSEMKLVRILRSQAKHYSLRVGDLLLTEGGDWDKLGRGAVWDGHIQPCLYQNHLFRVRCDLRQILPEYLAMYTSSTKGRSYFARIAKQTSNLATINSTELKAMQVPVPPLDLQRKLINSIQDCSDSIDKSSKLLAKMQSIKQGLIEDLLTGRVQV